MKENWLYDVYHMDNIYKNLNQHILSQGLILYLKVLTCPKHLCQIDAKFVTTIGSLTSVTSINLYKQPINSFFVITTLYSFLHKNYIHIHRTFSMTKVSFEDLTHVVHQI